MEHLQNIERFAVQAFASIDLKTSAKGAPMLIRKVENFLRAHKMAATKFGRLAAHDPRFVLDLRMGRIPRKKTEERTLQWMAEFEAGSRTEARPLSFRPKTNGHSDRRHALEVKGFRHAA